MGFSKLLNNRLPVRIFHLTDCEGTGFFFEAIKRSSILTYDSSKGLQFTAGRARPHFIFGGDVTDRGKYDLRITQLLLDFQKRHPDKVTLLVGNREIKNNRFKIELAPNLIRMRLLQGKPARWLPERLQMRPLDYLKKDMLAHGQNPEDEKALLAYVNALSVQECQLLYLRWMLENNMGCPHTFRFRREELKQILQKDDISDMEVLQSFLKNYAPEGLAGEYLQQAQVGVVVPGTRVLAIHGGITPINLGRVPGAMHELPIPNLQNWLRKFNIWYAQQIKEWREMEVTQLYEPGYTALDQSVLPIPGNMKYIITADMLNPDRQFTPIPSVVSEYLRQNQISVVLTGHQPSGDHPALVRNADNNLLFINDDTGYALGPANPDDTRGDASHAVEILSDPEKEELEISIHASLSDGTPVQTELKVTAEKIEGDPFIGRVAEDGTLVQCRLPDGNYRLAQQKGIQVFYSSVKADAVEKMFENKILSYR